MYNSNNNDFDAWKVFGDAGEDLLLNWLRQQDGVESADRHDHTQRTPGEITQFERKYGDIAITKNERKVCVEVKTDGLLQYTHNVGFEIWQTVEGFYKPGKGTYGWAHKNTESYYSSLFIVAPGVGLIVINDWNNFKAWMHDSPELFTTKFTRTGKSSSYYINIDVMLDKYKGCRIEEIDTTSIETLIQQTPMLKVRDDRFKTSYKRNA